MQRLLQLFLFTFLFSCSKDKVQDIIERPPSCDSSAFTYEGDIRLIIETNCAVPGCHIPGGSAQYDYRQYAVIADRIRTGRLEQRLELPTSNVLHMPKDRFLSDCEYYKIKIWISQGFPEK